MTGVDETEAEAAAVVTAAQRMRATKSRPLEADLLARWRVQTVVTNTKQRFKLKIEMVIFLYYSQILWNYLK